MKHASLCSSIVQGDGKRREDSMQDDDAISALHRKRPSAILRLAVAMGHVWTVPAVQEESDLSAKRSGAAMYPASHDGISVKS